MKKFVVAALAAVSLAAPAMADPRDHDRGEHREYHREYRDHDDRRYFLPGVIVGGILGYGVYEATRPQPVYPYEYERPQLPPPPYGYHYQLTYDYRCGCDRYLLYPNY